MQGLGPAFDIPRIRRNLLYWDKLDLPDNPVIACALPPEAKFLVDEGVLLKSPSPPWKGGMITPEVWSESNLEVWRQHDAREPGRWAMGQKSPSWTLPIEQPETRVVAVELFNVLPQPDDTVPLEAVYEFKKKRNDELQVLRSHLDQLYQEIIDSHDIPHARNAAIDDLERSLNDLNKVANETWGQRLMESVSVEINTPMVVAAATTLAAFALTSNAIFSAPIQLMAIGCLVASGLRFTVSKGTFVSHLLDHIKDFAYLYKPGIPMK